MDAIISSLVVKHSERLRDLVTNKLTDVRMSCECEVFNGFDICHTLRT